MYVCMYESEIERRLRPTGVTSTEGSPTQAAASSGHSHLVLSTSAKQILKSQWM